MTLDYNEISKKYDEVRSENRDILRLIPDDEYLAGLRQLESEIPEGGLQVCTSGDTLIWLQKRGSYEY